MPGYTHLQRGQPVTLGHHLLAWVEMLDRDRTRFAAAAEAAAESPLGAGFVAGGVASIVGFGIGSIFTPLLSLWIDARVAVAAITLVASRASCASSSASSTVPSPGVPPPMLSPTSTSITAEDLRRWS